MGCQQWRGRLEIADQADVPDRVPREPRLKRQPCLQAARSRQARFRQFLGRSQSAPGLHDAAPCQYSSTSIRRAEETGPIHAIAPESTYPAEPTASPSAAIRGPTGWPGDWEPALMATTSKRMSRLTSRRSKSKSSDAMQSDDRRLRIRLTPFPGRAWAVPTCPESAV